MILEAYIIALGMKKFGMETIDEETEIANTLRRIDDVTKRQEVFHNIVVNMVKIVVNMKFRVHRGFQQRHNWKR